MKLKIAQILLTFLGLMSVLMGLYFVFLRPNFVFFPEDVRFTQISSEQLQSYNNNLFTWIGFVFRSWGAFALSTGILIMGIAIYGLRKKAKWAYLTLALAGISSLSIFLLVNVSLHSDFVVVIGFLFVLYLLSLVLAFDDIFLRNKK